MTRNSDKTSLVKRQETRPVAPVFGPTWDIFDNFRRDFDRLVGSMLGGSVFGRATEPAFGVSPIGVGGVDVYEDADSLRISLDLPGMDLKDIHLSVTPDALTVRGERKTEEEASEEGHYHWRGASYGTFERTLSLPAEVDPDSAKARFKNGVLTVNIAKTQSSRARQVEIKPE